MDLLLIASGALITAFVLGWLAGWLTHRAAGPVIVAHPAPNAPPPPEDDAGQLAAAQAELREAHVEIEELRAYIDRKLARRPPEAG